MQDITKFLASLNIYRIQVPTPYPVGPVNLAHRDYLVSSGLLNTSKQDGVNYYSLKND